MERKTPFLVGEYYHVYTRGVDKRTVFGDSTDYRRIQLLLYLCNSTNPVRFDNLRQKYAQQGLPLLKAFDEERGEPVVSIIAYALMPNHLHLLLRERTEKGISRFMLKLMTAYSMHFNTKYQRSGPLFTRPFRSKHIDSDEYFRWLFSYIHLNPLELQEKTWKEQGIKDYSKAQEFIDTYGFSSLTDHSTAQVSRPETKIIDKSCGYDLTALETLKLKDLDACFRSGAAQQGLPLLG